MIKKFNDNTPQIANTAFISKAAYIVGEVKIGEYSSVWPGAVIRADFASIEIGNNTQIEDNCILHTGEHQVIGNNVHIGHGAVIHCAKIGNNVLIGNNATILDGAQIGCFCVVGANALVAEKMIVPDYSFVVGIPAKIKGRVSNKLIERIEFGVKEYVKMSQEYKKNDL